jgi:hypothetical protein
VLRNGCGFRPPIWGRPLLRAAFAQRAAEFGMQIDEIASAVPFSC